MKICIRPKQEKRITLGYRELAERMWFKEKNGKKLEISHGGNDEMFQEDFFLVLSLDKWLNDSRWDKNNSIFHSEHISMEYKRRYVYLYSN